LEYFLPAPIRHFLDSIFAPPLSFLQMARDYLAEASLAAGHGINLNHYFGFFSYLPPSMQAVVNSIIAGIIVLAILWLVKSIMRMYFAVKEAVKWW